MSSELNGKIALVTGASRGGWARNCVGVGRSRRDGLCRLVGRSITTWSRNTAGGLLQCAATIQSMSEVEALFEQIGRENARLGHLGE